MTRPSVNKLRLIFPASLARAVVAPNKNCIKANLKMCLMSKIETAASYALGSSQINHV